MTKQIIASGARLHRLGGGKGPDLVLIHGFGADRHSWLATAPAWFGTHRVWALELPAHGDAGPLAGPGDPAGLASSIARHLPRLKQPFALVGHSLGAAIALHLAKLLPQVVPSGADCAGRTGPEPGWRIYVVVCALENQR